MAGTWDSPPTPEELKAAETPGTWDTPPTPDELGQRAAPPQKAPEYTPHPYSLAMGEALSLDPKERAAQLAAQEATKDATLQSVIDRALNAETDDEGILEVARITGAPTEIVRSSYKGFKALATEMKFDAHKVRKANPELAALIVDNPNLAAVVVQDQKLSEFARLSARVDLWNEQHPWAAGIWKTGTLNLAPAFLNPALALSALKAELPELPEKQAAYQKSAVGAQGGVAGTWQMAKDTFSRARKQTEISSLGVQAMWADNNAEYFSGLDKNAMRAESNETLTAKEKAADLHRRIVDLENELGAEPDYPMSETPILAQLQQGAVDISQAMASQVSSWKGLGIGGGVGAAVVGGVALGLSRSPAAAAQAARGGAAVGAYIGTLVTTFNAEAGGDYLQNLRTVDASGKRMAPDIARAAAVASGVVKSFIESSQELATGLATLGPIGNFLRGGGTRAGAAAMAAANTGAGATIRRLSLDFAKQVGGEGLEEYLQQWTEALSNWAGSSASAGTAQPFDVAAAQTQAYEAGWKGAIGGLGIGAVQTTVSQATQGSLALTRYALEQSRQVRGLAQAQGLLGLKDSATAKAAPKAVAKLIQDATQKMGRPVREVYLDPARFTEAAEAAGYDARELAVELFGPEGPGKIQEALAKRQDRDGHRASFVIPLEQLVGVVVHHPAALLLANDITAVPNGMTAREMEEAPVADQETIKARTKALLEEQKAKGPWQPTTPAETALVQSIETHLQATGKFDETEVQNTVAQARAVVETLSQRAQVPADQLFASYAMKIQTATQAAAAPAVAGVKGVADEMRAATRPTLEALREAWTAETPEGRRQAYYTDFNTGLLNLRGLEVAPRDATRPFLAEWDLEGFKFLNDRFGHETADAALRAAAAALGARLPDAAKIGGSLRGYVRDQAQLDDITAAIQTAVGTELRVTSAMAATTGNVDADIDASSAAHKAFKGGEFAAGRLGHRKGAPASVMQGAPQIAFEKGMAGAALESPEAQAALGKAAEALTPTADRLRGTPVAQALGLMPAHEAGFAPLTEQETFETVHRDANGLLTEEGFRRALELNPKGWVASADMRGLKDANAAFGREGADAVAAVFSRLLAEVGGGAFDAARLHGDEFAGQFHDEKKLNRFFRAAGELASRLILYAKRDDGSFILQEGAYFAHGVARTYDEADRVALPEERKRQDASGRVRPAEVLSGRDFARRVDSLLRKGADRHFVDVRLLAQEGVRGDHAQPAGRRQGDLSRAVQGLLADVGRIAAIADKDERSAAFDAAVADSSSQLWKHRSQAQAVVETARLAGQLKREVGGEDKLVAPSIREALASVLEASNLTDEHASEKQDGLYQSWVDGGRKGPKPFDPALADHFDALNKDLEDLKGEDRVSGVLEYLYRKLKGDRHWTAIEKAVDVVRTVPGYERIRMPDAVIEQRLAAAEAARVEPEAEPTVNEDGVLVDENGEELFQDAYHGSPHRDIEKEGGFSLHRIGTGEGGQSYGYGMYFAQIKDVAEFYRTHLATRPKVTVRGEIMQWSGTEKETAYARIATIYESITNLTGKIPQIDEMIRYVREDIQKGIEANQKHLEFSLEAAGGDEQASRVKSAKRVLASLKKQLEAIEDLKQGDLKIEPAGQTYKVDVPENDELLDYDKPLREQPEKVQTLARKFLQEWAPERDAATNEKLMGQWTGADLYNRLAQRAGGPEAASQTLRILGIPGLLYLDQQSRAAGEGTHNFVIWDESRMPITETLYQGDQDRRGIIKIAKTGLNKAFTILLTDHSDLSTPLHELSHAYLEMLGDLAARDDIPQQVKDDFAKALAFVGAKDRESLTRDQKEQWAAAWEAYLMEGKAPSVDLVPVFQRFRAWLLRIYKSLKGLADALGVDPKLNEDIRGVFDRMLATDEEIAAMKVATGLGKPMFATADDAGMTPKQFEAYLREHNEGVTRAALRIQREVAEAQKRVMSDEWKKEVRREKERLAEEFDRRVDYRAWRYVRRGEMTNEAGEVIADLSGPDQGLLDRATVHRNLGKSSLLTKRLRGRLTTDGLKPIEVAKLFGIKDVMALWDALIFLPDRDKHLREESEAAARAAHPELAFEREQLEEKAEAAFHAEGTADSLLKEWAALLRKGQIAGMPPAASIREAARIAVDQHIVRRLSLGNSLAAERRAAERCIAAAAKGDFETAAGEKEQQLLNHFMFGELARAREDKEHFEDLIGRIGDRKHRARLEKAGLEYADAMDTILEAVGAVERADPEEIAERTPLLEAFKMLEKDGLDLAVNTDTLAEILGRGGSWKDFTVGEMRVVRTAVAQLYTAALDRNTMILEGRRQEIDGIATEIATDAKARADKGPAPGSETAKAKGKVQAPGIRQTLQGIGASLTDPEEMLRELGPTAHRVLWTQGYLQARQAEDKLTREVTQVVGEMWNQLPKELQARRYELLEDLDAVPFPEDVNRDSDSRDRMWMWMVALNLGNESNRDRLIGGYQWDEARVRAWLDRNMTEEEWTFVQSVWDLMDKKLWPEVARAYKDVNGIEPPKIQAVAFKTRFGIFRGGYFPARYDPVASRLGQAQSEEALTKMYSTQAARMSVVKGFTKERAKKYKDVVNLQWGVVPSHVLAVIRYVTHDRFVRDAARLLNNGKAQTAINRHLGLRYLEQLIGSGGWIPAVANFAADSIPGALKEAGGVLQLGKSRMVVSTLGWSLTVAAGDLSNPLVSLAAGHISAASLAASAIKTLPLINWRGARDEALAKSPELNHRKENLTKLLQENLAEIGRRGVAGKAAHLIDAVRDSAWFLFEQTDKLMATIIWHAAFRDGLHRAGATEQSAVEHADEQVRRSLPSYDPGEQPAILRDKRGVGSLIAFYGYFNKLYNVERGLFAEKSALEAMARSLAVILVANVLGELLSGRGPEEDEEPPEWILRKTLAGPFALVPMFGFLGEWAAAGIASKLFQGEAQVRPLSMRASPVAAGVERLIKHLGRLVDEDRENDTRFWDALEAFGVFSGLPIGSAQVGRTGRYLTSEEGLAEDVGEGDLAGIASGLVYGKRERQGGNILNQFSE